MPPAAGEPGISPDLQAHVSEEGGMPSYGTPSKPKAKLPGMDLVEQVAQHNRRLKQVQADIEKLFSLLESQQQSK